MTPIPVEFRSMLPYLLTVLVLIILSTTSAPGTLGEPYVREEG